ncbi:MAG: beta-lactamase family protein [Gammaproteobacteria bacterium]|nr:beta-lactamase family protein [Gammaproteobacteria bacterium]MBU2057998.1 beta-lactamase family protein [Gammaproteobacteria bacterium]MBU2174350.1 beta-lactamase family protein [Gammaproteobacteria bacterium]MBU2247699.1 beta-lactamase family protein [Gammaproteobacteria bacterium]MBU2346091.1 beta-lactamase family protein [Gammaproteobacteria bacterium]
MTKFSVFALLCLFSVCAVRAQTSAVDIQAAVDAQLRANEQKHGIPGQAVLVLHNSDILYRSATGTAAIGDSTPVTPKTVFPVYSVSKLFAITLVMQLQEEGKLDMSAPASRYVDDLPQSWRTIRIDQFLNHVSGVPEYFDSNDFSRPFPPSLAAVFATLKDVPVSAPGERTRYTNTNNLVIAAVLESVTRTPYRTLVRQRIIEKLDLQETWLKLADVPKARLVKSYRAKEGKIVPDLSIAWPDYSIAHGGAYMTLDDAGKFMSAVAQGRLVSKAELKRLWQPYQFANGDLGFFAAGWDYGKSGRWHQVGHDGGTKVRVRILFDKNPDDHYIVIYLTNGNKDGVWSSTLVDSVQRLIVPE